MKENRIINRLIENSVLVRFEELKKNNVNNLKYYEIIDKVEIEKEELEFLNNDYCLVYKYDIVESMCRKENNLNIIYLVIVVENDRLLYLLLNNENEVIESFEMNEEMLFDSIYS